MTDVDQISAEAEHTISHLHGRVMIHDGLVQERRNSIANALELRLSSTNLSMYVLNILEANDQTLAGPTYYIIIIPTHSGFSILKGPQVSMYAAPWAPFNIKTIFPGVGISNINISWSWDCLIFMMEITMLERWHLYTETQPWWLDAHHHIHVSTQNLVLF